MRIKIYLLTFIAVLLYFTNDPMQAQNLTVAGDGSIGGDLGIGTQNPAAMLHFRAQANDTDKLLNFAENDNLSFFFETGFAGTGVLGNTLKLDTFGNDFTQNAMTWRGDGNVGIGALNPAAKLQILNGSNNTGSAISISDAQLKQNQPNPFNQTTTIQYFIPDEVSRAELRITDAAGRVLKSVIVDTRGTGQTTLDATILSSGAYQYSLFLDGRLLETKQMVLSK